jgi:hypothetical protein
VGRNRWSDQSDLTCVYVAGRYGGVIKRTGTGEVPDTPTTGFATIGVVLQPAMFINGRAAKVRMYSHGCVQTIRGRKHLLKEETK